jgi:hypothetical protein
MNAMGTLMKAKIRGIYSTAITKMLLENGFEIVQPSLTIKNRFGLSNNSALPDIKIKDRYDLQGVRVLGSFDAVNAFQSILYSEFEDVLTRKWRVDIDGIYKGKPIESDEDTVYVDIGNDVIGRLPKHESAIVEDKPLLVQVERKRIGAKQPILTTKLKIVGNHAILAQNSRVGVSLKIHDLNKRAELYALGKALAPEDWGIIWRESSANQPRAMLENEVAKLGEKTRILNEKATRAEAPALLIEGLGFMDVEFPHFSKKSLDKLRASVAPTLDGHHFYKCCGGEVSAALEMAEKLLEKGQNRIEIEKSFREQLLFKFPEEGSLVDVEHVKPSGFVFYLGQAAIESLDDKRIEYSRIIRSDGFYDGLGVKKEAGDKAVSETKMGEWYITTKYFSNNGEWKGTYINLNTPVEIYPKTIRYVDLEVDVCILPDGTSKILDVEKLEKALEKGYISRKLFGKMKEKAKEITEANDV